MRLSKNPQRVETAREPERFLLPEKEAPPFSTAQAPSPNQERLKKEAENLIEKILRGESKPIEGMRIHILINGPFTIFDAETSEGSVFEYKFPCNGIEEKAERPDKETGEGEEEPEVEVEKIFSTK